MAKGASKSSKKSAGAKPKRVASQRVTSPPRDSLTVMGGTGKPAKRPAGSRRPAGGVSIRGTELPDVRTVIYVHGIGNKPQPTVLKCQWDRALFGVEMGDRTRMAYWVNRARYLDPSPGTCSGGDTVDLSTEETMFRAHGGDQVDLVGSEVEALGANAKERKMLASIAAKIEAKAMVEDAAVLAAARGQARMGIREAGTVSAQEIEAKILPLPAPIRRLIMKRITRALLRDAHDYFFDAERRRVMRESLIERIRSGGGPFVIVAHSMGSLIAYDVLRDLTKAGADVRLLVTFGSPLGIAEMQDFLRSKQRPLRVPACVGRWVNVSDLFDPVALDGDISNDFAPNGGVRIENHLRLLLNPDSPRNPHSATGYLATRFVREAVQQEAGSAFAQAIARFTVTRDLVGLIEDAHPAERHHVLIQLVDPHEARKDPFKKPRELRPLAELRTELEAAILKMTKDEQRIDVMKRFIAAELTREEIERLRTDFAGSHVDIVWRDAEKRALILDSTQTVQCRPAHETFDATGRDIRWAVLDTGVNAAHPHFARYSNIEAQWDCTVRGRAKDLGAAAQSDGHGHGTHVAGILAGKYEFADGPVENGSLSGMSPETRLHIYKVLADQGRGKDSYVLKALEHIERTNDDAGRLVIHGLNLSLGGPFDPSVYGCGHTPICQELRRLWRQGVLVVVAAGNDGFAVLESERGTIEANMDLSIGDPANLEDCIAVGSVHKTNPHTYGVSFFSSRGPTADGRMKPDLVAPGEKIVSAAHRFPAKSADWRKLYVQMSGTSMAAPHVSGILAAYLSLRREFIGEPDRVKETLLANCASLDRDPYVQGHGLPSLMRMAGS